MAAFSTIWAIASVAFSVISAKMQKDRAKKAAKYAADDANRAASLEFVVEATVLPLAIPYGRCKVGGIRTLHVVPPTSLAWILFFQSYGRTAWGNTILDAYNGLISGALDYTVPSTARNARTFSNTTLVHDNSKVNKRDRYKYQNEVLIMQQAICYKGINQILYVFVDDKPWESVEGVHVNVYCDGGVVDPLIAQQGYTENSFSNAAYATGAFLLNREQAQFSGAPQLTFLLEGMMVRFVNMDTNQNPVSYYLTSQYEKSYSNNPALCLLDFLLDGTYGVGLNPSRIDLESFFNAMIVCETVVLTDVEKNGRFWANTPDARNIKRFECNITLNSEVSLRDNITKILNSMDMAELIWSGGKYKLQLKYPVVWDDASSYAYKQVTQWLQDESLDLYKSLLYNNTSSIYDEFGVFNEVGWERSEVAAYLTDENIMRGKDISVSYPNAQTRYNQVIVKFRNESKEFAEDTVNWPNKDSSKGNTFIYTGYRAEDNGEFLETEIFEDAITDYWHAMAKAEQICRSSREQHTLKLSISAYFSFLEPGDIIHITSNILNMPGRLFIVSASKVGDDNTLEVEADSYDARTLAWNALDDEVVPPLPILGEPPLQAINLSYSNNALTWGRPNDSKISRYEIKYTVTPPGSITSNTYWVNIGEVSSTAFNIPSTVAPGVYTFTVVSKTPGGQLAEISGWPVVAGTVTEDYLPPLEEPSYLNIVVFAYAAEGIAPDIPVGGVYSFNLMQLSTVPLGWSPSIPAGTGVVWQSIGLVEHYPGDATYNMTGQWLEPTEYIGVSTEGISAVLVPNLVTVLQNSSGENTNYDGAIGSYQVFLDGVEISESADVVYSVVESTNCTVTINSVPGAQQGNFSVVLLEGDFGSALLRASYDGDSYDAELTVVILDEGYIVDLSVPPTPDIADITITSSFTSVIVSLDSLPDYTEGNGHTKTNVYCARVPIDASEPIFTDAILLDSFTGIENTFLNINDYWHGLNEHEWLTYDYYFWFSFTTRDGIESLPTSDGDLLLTFNKINTNSLEDNAVTLPVSTESFSSLTPLALPSTNFGDVAVLITITASGLLTNTPGENADMELRRNTTLLYTIPMLVGTQQIGSVPMASGSFTFVDNPGAGSHEYELTITGLNSGLYQSISAIGLKK